ncbi:Hypothetical protein CpCP13_0612 [Corynebacterium pseudotuberculosis]|nr:Hypothetical protein CpPAT10_0600a [Corynebacterium pseudotuberculosis PAT10]AFF21754.1 Hypothetical protein CpP54B96_0609 [Corynebacterium pseudotuberculosis P54B96]AFH51528.1 Hypothetical protein Cp267_0625 [Corynebacterium pseudotuberculosis 267]AJC13336.1 hypothetical protein CpVD57_0613 [Corynebacterium pseudotuberculosis]AKJ55271.1 Hypothetical protein Cp12C_0637 [Corynebacterium pseudotuberculosis]
MVVLTPTPGQRLYRKFYPFGDERNDKNNSLRG